MIDVLTFGEAMVSLRSDGPVATSGSLRTSIAGAETNVSIGLARLGHRARWAGLTGHDAFGHLVLRTLRAEGVDVSHARRVAEPTGIVVFEPRTADLTRVDYHRRGSAGSALGAADIEAALDPLPRVVHATGVTAGLGREPLGAVCFALKAAAARTTSTSFDVNYRAKLWSRNEAAEAMRPLMRYVDVLVASDDELALVAPDSATTEAARVAALLNTGVREVILKRGADGAEFFNATGRIARPALRVPVRDTVGAGDAFVAGYLSALLDGKPAGERLDRAVTTGAFAVATTGDWEGLPERTELDLLHIAPGSAIR